MMDEMCLIGAAFNVFLNDLILYEYEIGEIKATRQGNGGRVLYDTEGEARNVLTGKEMKALVAKGELRTYLRCIDGRFLIKVISLDDRRRNGLERIGKELCRRMMEEVIPDIQRGERRKISSWTFAERVARYMGDGVDERTLTDIADKCGYRVGHFVENYREWCDRFTVRNDYFKCKYAYNRVREFWWVKLKGMDKEKR